MGIVAVGRRVDSRTSASKRARGIRSFHVFCLFVFEQFCCFVAKNLSNTNRKGGSALTLTVEAGHALTCRYGHVVEFTALLYSPWWHCFCQPVAVKHPMDEITSWTRTLKHQLGLAIDHPTVKRSPTWSVHRAMSAKACAETPRPERVSIPVPVTGVRSSLRLVHLPLPRGFSPI